MKRWSPKRWILSRTSQEVRELKCATSLLPWNAPCRTSQEVRELKFRVGYDWLARQIGRTSQEVRELKSAGPCGGLGRRRSHLARGA